MSLTSDDLADIKQLMTSLLNAQARQLEEHIDGEIAALRKEMDERFEEIDERFDEVLNAIGSDLESKAKTIDAHDEQLESHERRITQLEAQAA